MSKSSPGHLSPIKAFLSHRYRSPSVNLRFFEIFSKAAQVQFSVDLGELATNVTRLERLVRDADAFIGVYPLPADPQQTASPETLQQQSRYFRLELDLAMRARLPTIVFADSRYGNVLTCPSLVRHYAFDAQEVEGSAWGPRMQVFAKAFASFCDEALAYQAYRINQAVNQRDRAGVALLLPPADYPAAVRRRVRLAIEEAERQVIELDWPPQLSKAFYAATAECDWIVVDVGDRAVGAGVTGFLHGSFVPAIRLVKSLRASASAGTLRRSLFGGVDVGFPKDIVQWSTPEELESAIRARLKTIMSPQRLIDNEAAAIDYFQSASRRQEVIFVSYAGKDASAATPIIAALNKAFKTVFDYRDGASIVPGKPWLDEIFNTLSRSAVGVMLLSPSYLESGNCVHEAQELVARHDDGKLALLPLRMSDDKLEVPAWLQRVQHARLQNLQGAAEVPDLVVKLLAASPRS